VQKTTCCNSTSNAPDDGRMYPKHVELRIHQYDYLVASSWHFALFHEEDARSNITQITGTSCFLSLPLYKQQLHISKTTFPSKFTCTLDFLVYQLLQKQNWKKYIRPENMRNL